MQQVLFSASTRPGEPESTFPLEFIQLDDSVDLGRLFHAAFPQDPAAPATLADWIDIILGVLSGSQGRVLDGCSFVVRTRAGLIGASLVVLRDGVPWLTHLAVLPLYQQQGLGTALLAATSDALYHAHYPTLWVASASGTTSPFLIRHHFQPQL